MVANLATKIGGPATVEVTMDRIDELQNKIVFLEMRCARLGDEWLKRVCREDIQALCRELKKERAKTHLKPPNRHHRGAEQP